MSDESGKHRGSVRLSEWKAVLKRAAAWAREHVGTTGEPDTLKDGGPGDSDCMATFLASVAYGAGQRCRLVGVLSDDGRGAMFVEIFHPGFPPATKIMDMPADVRGGFHPEYPNFQWIPILPFHGWIAEGAEILKWKRIWEEEL